MDQLISFYKGLLQSLNVVADEQGYLSSNYGDQSTPYIVSEKRVVLPTFEILREGNWNGRVAFHPLSEIITRAGSPILKTLRLVAKYRLMYSIGLLMDELMTIAATNDCHNNLSPEELKMLQVVPDVDAKTVDYLNKIIAKIDPHSQMAFMNIYLKRGASLKGRNYARAAMVDFPIMEQFEKEENDIYGVVPPRKKDKVAVAALFKWIFPYAEDPTFYSFGSSHTSVPFFEALTGAYVNVADRINTVAKIFKKNLKNYKEIHIDLSWTEGLSQLDTLRAMVPSLDGNDGEKVGADKDDIKSALSLDSKGMPVNQTAGFKPLGKPIEGATPIASTLGKPLGLNNQFGNKPNTSEDWGAYMDKQAAVAYPTFNGVNSRFSGAMNTMANAGYGPANYQGRPGMPQMQQPASPVFRGVHVDNRVAPAPVMTGAGWAANGVINSI